MNNPLQLLQHHQIDPVRWDAAITASANGRVYALSWFLNEMAPGWKALATPDYRLIMPLPVRKKWGIEYLFQPAFTQQLGLFSTHHITAETFNESLQLIARHFYYAEINANAQNKATTYNSTLRKNYLLPLHHSYEFQRKAFSRSAIRNMDKAVKAGIFVTSSQQPEKLLQLHRLRYGQHLATNAEYEAFGRVLQTAASKKMAHFYYASNKQGDVIASSGYLQFQDRLVFIINGNTEESLQTGATHLLKDHVIRQFAGQLLVMDFEGSDTPQFARFYEQYGATDCDNYPFFKINHLPLPLRWLKE